MKIQNQIEIKKEVKKYYSKRKKDHSNMLFIDGGGTKGIFAAELFEVFGKENYEKFNIISGTSIGGILALAYEIIPFDNVKELSIKLMKKCFQQNKISKFWNIAVHGSIYSSKKIKKLLKKFFGDKKIKDLTKEKIFFINTANFNKSKFCIINNIEKKWQETYLWEVAYWTSAAPIYFNHKDNPYIDGGVWANDPRIILPLIEDELGKLKRHSLLSIGFFARETEIKKGRWILNLKRISKYFDLLINMRSEITDIEFKNMKQTLRIELDKDGTAEIPLSLINDEVLAFYAKRAQEESANIKAFIKKMNT